MNNGLASGLRQVRLSCVYLAHFETYSLELLLLQLS